MRNAAKILILDDEKLITSSLKSLLALEGFSDAVFFNSPSSALEYLKNNCRDVIISDFMMDKMNGIEFLSAAAKLYPNSARILLTGYADKENAIKAINEAGLYKYIEKPWDNANLILSIKNAYERAHLTEELEKTNKQLKNYSENLETLVKEKTADIISMNERLSAVINNCADAVATVSKNGIITDANPAAESLFGMSKELLKTKNIKELFDSKTEKIEEILNSAEKKLFREIYAVNAADGSRTPVEISSAYIEKADEHVFVIRNMNYHKEMERLREDFTAALTHDLRTPSLAAIQTLEYFIDGSLGSLNDKQKTLLAAMKRSHEDMLGLVNTLLEVYKYESGRPELVKTPFDFEKLIEECIEQVKPIADSKNQTIEKILIQLDNREVYADRNEIRRVIVNLLGNAVKYTQSGGLIQIRAQFEGDDLLFSVKDNGEGIAAADIPLLFKRFTQGSSGRRSIGTGLGLYLSKQIIDAHGGKIWIESSKNKGSEFFFLLINAAVKDTEKLKVWTI